MLLYSAIGTDAQLISPATRDPLIDAEAADLGKTEIADEFRRFGAAMA